MCKNVEAKLRIYFMSDIHGYLFPIDYATNRFAKSGLFSCSKQFEVDDNTLVIDGGDTLQGSPFAAYVHNLYRKAPNNHICLSLSHAMNKCGFNYVTLGNHDFNYGTTYLRDYLNALKATCLCANVHGDLLVRPYDIKVLGNGLRVGITGVVTSHVNVWELPENLDGVTVSDPFEAAKTALAELKDKVDITICIYHGGFERDFETDEILSISGEHIASRICKELDFDLLLTGHQHMAVEGQKLHNTYVVQPRANAVHALCIDAELSSAGISFESKFIYPDGNYDNNDLEELLEIEGKIETWLDKPVGTLSHQLKPEDKVTMALNGSEIADFFNMVQLDATNAQISCTSLTNEIKGFPQDVSLRNILSNYPYADSLKVLEVSGEQLKIALERTASYLEISESGEIVVSSRFLVPKIEHYNYDYFAGITYIADLRRPVGDRIVEIRHKDAIVTPSDKFSICMTHYRATGTGGYEVYRSCPILHEGHTGMSTLIQEYLQKHEITEITNYARPTYIF